jgi:hypothetical protein
MMGASFWLEVWEQVAVDAWAMIIVLFLLGYKHIITPYSGNLSAAIFKVSSALGNGAK